MRVTDNYHASPYEADRALIVYRNDNGRALCTINKIDYGTILPGVPIDGAKLAELFAAVGSKEAPKKGTMVWTDPRILARGANAVLWYARPRRTEIFFSCSSAKMMRCSGKVIPWPGLVFLAKENKLRVFAVKSRPAKTTPLYFAPYWNLSDGAVCLPNNVRGQNHSLDEWERIFYTSAFSHPGWTRKVTRTAYDRLIPALIRSKAKRFPASELIDAKLTLQQLMEGKR